MSETIALLHNIGYQGLSIDSFLEILIKNGINTIVDIRLNPYSRNKNFSRSKLSEHLLKNRIEYYHFKQLGSPESIRAELKESGDYIGFFKAYRNHLNTQSDTLSELLNILLHKKVCLLCMEHDINICHRKIVIEKLLELAPAEIKIESVDL